MSEGFELVHGKSGQEENDEKELQQLLAGNGGKVYPVLRNHEWIGVKGGVVFMPLIGTFEAPKVVIALAYDMPENLIYVPHKTGGDFEEVNALYDEAQKNLEELVIPINMVEKRGHIAVDASGHEFSSELLLSKPFLKKMHTILDAEQILIAVPRRGYLKAIASNTSKTIYNKFIDEYEAIFADESIEKPRIANGVFVIENGKIVQRAGLEKY